MPGGGSKKQTVGYRYFLGAHMALCHGPIDAITEIQVDKRVAWTGLVTEGTITVDAPTLFGGEKREGGVSGTIDVEMGYPAQTPNAYLQSQLGADVPAFRGVASLVFNQTYMGNNPYLKPWKFKASRLFVKSDGELQWRPEFAAIDRPEDGGDITDCFGSSVRADTFVFANQPASYLAWQAATGNEYALSDGDFGSASYVESNNLPYSFIDRETAWVLSMANSDSMLYTPVTNTYGTTIRFITLLRMKNLSNSVTVINAPAQFLITYSTIDSPQTVNFQIQFSVDVSNDRARFIVNLSGGSDGTPGMGNFSLESDWFDFDITSTDQWLLFSGYGQYGDTYFFESEEVGREFNIAMDGVGSVCVVHFVNGEEVRDSFDFTWLWRNGGSTEPTNPRVSPSYSVNPSSGSGGAILGGFIYGVSTLFGEPDSSGVPVEYDCADFSLEDCQQSAGCADMNPVHIIRECLTDATWGMGYTDADIDDLSFIAASNKLFDEHMGVSILWEREQPIEEFISEILRHIDAVLYVSRSSGRFVLKLIREEDSLLTLDESNISDVSDARRPTISELTNQVAVTYWDATTDESASVVAHNEALRLVQGVEISTSVQYPGFTNKAIAARVAERDLKALSTPLLSCEIVASRDAAILNVGDPFTLDWPDLNINQTVMRVDEIDYGDGVDNSIKITAVQDVFSTPALATVSDTDEEWVDPTAASPQASVARVITETPYYPLILEAGETQANDILADDPDAGFLLASGGRQQNELNANVQVDTGSGYVNSATVDFHPYAYLAGPIGYTDTVLTIESGKDLDLVETGTIAQIGAELVRIDSVDQDSTGEYVSITVGRGILDTVPQAHEIYDSDGIIIAFWGDYAISDNEQYVAGESIDVKLQTTQGGSVLALDDAPVDEVTFDSRAIRPYPPGDFKIDDLSYPDPYTWTASHTLTWAHRDRLQQTDGNLYDHTEGDIGPEAGVSYVVEGIAIVGDSVAGDSTVDAPERAKFLDVNVGTDTEYTFDIDSGVFDSNYSEPPEGTTAIILGVKSQRDGYDSWQYPQIRLQYPGFTDSVGDSAGLDSVGDSAGYDSMGADSVGDSNDVDPFFADVKLLLHAEGANGSTTFTDSSNNGVTVTGNSGAIISTGQAKFGGSSIRINGTADAITFPGLFDMGAGDWTAEWFYRADNASTEPFARMFQTRNGDVLAGIGLNQESTTSVQLYADAAATGGWDYSSGAITISHSVWQHYALVRNGSTITLYIDGVSKASTTVVPVDDSAQTWIIGGQTVATSRSVKGFFDEIRFTEGVARYTSNFTPPTAPFPDS